jgi:hypothetical protein
MNTVEQMRKPIAYDAKYLFVVTIVFIFPSVCLCVIVCPLPMCNL